MAKAKSRKRRSRGAGSLFKNSSGYYCYQYTTRDGRKKTKSLRTKNFDTAKEKAEAFSRAQNARDQQELMNEIGRQRGILNAHVLPFKKEEETPFKLESEGDSQFFCSWRDDEGNELRLQLRCKRYKSAKREAEKMVDSPVWDAFMSTMPTAGPTTLHNYRRTLDALRDWLEENYPSINSLFQVDVDLANEFLQERRKNNDAAKTYAYYRNGLGLITKEVAEKLKLKNFDNPWPKTAKRTGPQQKRSSLTEKQTTDLLALFDNKAKEIPHREELRLVVLLCLYAGMRLRDAVYCTWPMIDLDTGKIEYTPRKTRSKGKTALVPILPPLRAALLSLPRDDKDKEKLVLPAVAGTYERNPDGIQKPLVELIQSVTGKGHENGNDGVRCKVKRSAYGAHSLRHTFASMAAMAGAKATYLARMLGVNITTAEKYYVHVGYQVQLIKGFDAVPKMIEAKAQTDPERAELHRLADDLPIKKVRELLKAAKK